MTNRLLGYLITIAGCAATMQPGTALILGLVIIVSGETITRIREARWPRIELANRRDCMVIAEAWPAAEEEGPELPDIYDGLYEYHLAADVAERAEEFTEELQLAGNASATEDLPAELRLPVKVIYARHGRHRMETREEYARRLQELIKTTNTDYHATLEQQNGGHNYMADYLLRR